MAQKNIDFGSFPDDPDADAIRTAFQKTQENFDELYNNLDTASVASVNQTPRQGITVNNPTGNVVVSANIYRVQVQTNTLGIGIGSNTGVIANYTSGAQTLNVDLLDDTVIANSLVVGNATSNVTISNGNIQTTGNITSSEYVIADFFTGTLATAAQPNITSVGNLTSLKVNGVSNLGPVGNVIITGGTNGYVLQTDGAGVLSWVVQSGATGPTGATGATGIGATGATGEIGSTGSSGCLLYTSPSPRD